MMYDAIQHAYERAVSLWNLALLASGKSEVVTTTVTFVKRQNAELCKALGATLPVCGIYGLRAATQGRDQTKRDSVNTIVFDYYAEDTNPVRLAKQAELAAEAILKIIDGLPAGGSGIYGVGEGPQSITVDFTDGYAETESDTEQPNYFRRATVTVPVWDRDTGL